MAKSAGDDRPKDAGMLTNKIAAFSSLVALAAVIVSLYVAKDQLRNAREQYAASAQVDQFNNLIKGLASPSSAEQLASVRGLVNFVTDPDNYKKYSRTPQETQQEDVSQILQTFIKAATLARSHQELNDFESGEPDIVPRSFVQFQRFASKVPVDADFALSDLHGISAPQVINTHNVFFARAIDLRLANLSGSQFKGRTTFTNGFLTCANLTRVDFGTADMHAADLSGAKLQGAALQGTKLRPEQVAHAQWDRTTRFPFKAPVMSPWSDDRCRQIVVKMTGMTSGQGFAKGSICPQNIVEAGTERPSKGLISDIIEVCKARGAV